MRPVEKRGFPSTGFGPPLVSFLLQGLGPYCSFCERPLPDECWLWDKRSGDAFASGTHQIVGVVDDWSRYLVLDRNCAWAHQAHLGGYRRGLAGGLLMPDEEVTFRRGGHSPVEYAIRTVKLVVIDEEDEDRVVERREEDVVLAIGRTDEAMQTIDHFALNTPYFRRGLGGALDELQVPAADYYAAVDRRVDQRTDVWHMAEDVLSLLREAGGVDPAVRERLVAEARSTIAAAGFWSTWATVLMDGIPEGMLRELLSPDGPSVWEVGPGPHNVFPGTRVEWFEEGEPTAFELTP